MSRHIVVAGFLQNGEYHFDSIIDVNDAEAWLHITRYELTLSRYYEVSGARRLSASLEPIVLNFQHINDMFNRHTERGQVPDHLIYLRR